VAIEVEEAQSMVKRISANIERRVGTDPLEPGLKELLIVPKNDRERAQKAADLNTCKSFPLYELSLCH
jgi:hypothetical protein